MRHTLLLCMLLMASTGIYAQHTIRLQIKKDEEKQLLAGATVTIPSLKKSVVSDSAGIAVFTNITAGSYKITISYVGLEEVSITVVVPQPTANLTEILLKEAEASEQEVIVTATRTSRTISDIPTRVETISGEELEEKGNMKPGDIRMLLNESTGIQTQQTSATSYNSSIRIQGLDGRYTQILRDGFPLYSGFSGGLSLMQVAPLDLKQIEVIKGSSSTLYGGGAIAGLVNLVSKTPTAKRELSFLGNATSAGGIDLSGFYSQRFKKTGITVFGSGNTSKAYDPAGIGLTAIPQSERYTIQPRLFFYGDRTTANIGFGYITENRTGGSMDYIEKGAPGYFEKYHTDRFSTQAELTHKLSNKEQLIIKYSYTRFNRLIQIPGYAFSGLQQSSFSEATYNRSGEKTQWIAGANFLTDDFKEKGNDPLRNYDYHTLGAFIQNTWTPIKKLSFETGLRGDYVKQFGFEWLPRVAVLFKISPALTARLGGGMGYKNPTLFTEEAERMQFQHILPMNENTTVNECSSGGSLDVNYRTKIGDAGISFNQLFFIPGSTSHWY